MNKKLLKSVTALTMAGGALLGTTSNLVKADVISGKEKVEKNAVVFHDVPQNHWAFNAITNLANRNIIAGYGNRVFGLGDAATREQVAALIYRVLGLTIKGGTLNSDNFFYVMKDGSKLKNPYGDIDKNSTMFLEEILTLTDLGIFKGDESGNFRPKSSLSRAEMAQVIKNAFKVPVLREHTFNDIPENSWAKDAISAVQSNSIASGTGNGKFEPNKTVTREQYAQFLFNALNYKERPTEEKQPNEHLDEKKIYTEIGGIRVHIYEQFNNKRITVEDHVETFVKNLDKFDEQCREKVEELLKQQGKKWEELHEEFNNEAQQLFNKFSEPNEQLNTELQQLSDKHKNQSDKLREQFDKEAHSLNDKLKEELQQFKNESQYLNVEISNLHKYVEKELNLLKEKFTSQISKEDMKDATSDLDELAKENVNALHERINAKLSNIENSFAHFE